MPIRHTEANGILTGGALLFESHLVDSDKNRLTIYLSHVKTKTRSMLCLNEQKATGCEIERIMRIVFSKQLL